ncbi:MAG: hypothetical protein IJY53_04825 [Akkermansia sp.]|nr:hypothetical protein [Akkermansia sp.]
MNEFADFLEQGAAESFSMLGEPVQVQVLPGSVVYDAVAVISPVPVAYPVALGGAVLDCSATALLSRAALPSLRIGWRISTASGWVYEVLRVESSSLDPLWHVELTRRK